MSDASFFGLTDKVAVVIGGGQGIGEATSVRLGEVGCHVAVVDLDQARAEAVADRVRALGRRATAIAIDVLDVEQASATIARVEADLGALGVMVTVVGQAETAGVLEITPAIWDSEHRRNLRYFFFYAQAAAKAMIHHGAGGVITAVGSITGIESAPTHAAYGAAKAGMINLVKSMAVELAADNIRLNVVAPGTIKTPRIVAGKDFGSWDALIRNSLIPQRRLGEAKEVADAIVFLSSIMATYITGATLAVDGGFTAQWLLGVGARKRAEAE